MNYGNGGLIGGGAALGHTSADQVCAAQLPTPRTPAVTMHLEQTLKSAEILHQVIEQLEARIAYVCQPGPPATQGGADKQPSELVPLANGIAEINRRLSAAIQRLHSLTERVDL